MHTLTNGRIEELRQRAQLSLAFSPKGMGEARNVAIPAEELLALLDEWVEADGELETTRDELLETEMTVNALEEELAEALNDLEDVKRELEEVREELAALSNGDVQ